MIPRNGLEFVLTPKVKWIYSLQNSADKKFTYYIAMELSGADLLTKMNEKISNDERLKIDYDYEKFKETFNKEMDEMSKR